MVGEALDTNLFGAWRMCIAFIPLLRKSKHGRVVNVSSEAGPCKRLWSSLVGREHSFQAVEEHALRRQDLAPRLSDIEPGRLVDLGKILHPA